MNSKHLNTLFHTCKVIFVCLQVEIPQKLNIAVTFPWSESVKGNPRKGNTLVLIFSKLCSSDTSLCSWLTAFFFNWDMRVFLSICGMKIEKEAGMSAPVSLTDERRKRQVRGSAKHRPGIRSYPNLSRPGDRHHHSSQKETRCILSLTSTPCIAMH